MMAFTRVDFPVFGRPTIATKPERKGELTHPFSHHQGALPIP
jgi:hypothetical protein